MFQTFLSTCATLKDMIKRKRFQVLSPPPNPQNQIGGKIAIAKKKQKSSKMLNYPFF